MAGIGMVRRVGACAYLVVRVKGDGRAQHAQQQLIRAGLALGDRRIPHGMERWAFDEYGDGEGEE